MIRQWPEAFIMAGDWYRGVPERHEQRREWKVAARAAHPNPCVAEQAETCEPPLPKPGERFHVVACLHAAWNEAASDYFSRAEWERWDSLNDEDAARVVLLTALTRDADFTGWEVGLSLPWESAAGMPQDGRAMKDFGQAERYVELAKRSYERLAARWREREKLEKMKPETMRLDESLRALSGAFRNLHWFEEYAKGRERAIALHVSMRQSLSHEANRRLQQQQDANRGHNLADALSAAVDATNDLTRMANEPPAHNAPDSTIRLMQRDLQWIRWRAYRVRMLGLTGATQRLNATLKPNADGEPCSIELQKRAEQAELLHVDWMMLFQVPGKSLNAAVATLTDLSRYFGKLTGQLRAIIETEGYEAPATGGTQAIDLAAVKEMIAALLTRDDDDTNPPHARSEVVLWEGAVHTDRNVRLARTRSAYLEAHGDVQAAMAALKQAGHRVSRSTFYNHLDALDLAIPRWRESVQLSNPNGKLDGMKNVGTRGKSWDKVR